jgi:hypothetical protein
MVVIANRCNNNKSEPKTFHKLNFYFAFGRFSFCACLCVKLSFCGRFMNGLRLRAVIVAYVQPEQEKTPSRLLWWSACKISQERVENAGAQETALIFCGGTNESVRG